MSNQSNGRTTERNDGTSNVQIGTVIKGEDEIRVVPAGTKLIKVGTTDVRTREVHGGRWFVEGGSGWGNDEWVVVGVVETTQEAPKPDLSDKGALALELYRVRTEDPERTQLPDYSADLWLKAAKFVLDNFELKTARNAQVGDRVKVVGSGDGEAYVPSRVQGETGTVRETIDSDDELYIEFDYTSAYVHFSALELV